MSTEKKLYKSNRNKMLGGVCGGIGEYFGVDPTLVRLAFVALCILAGGGLIAYIIALIIIPEAPAGYEPKASGSGTTGSDTAGGQNTSSGNGGNPNGTDNTDGPTMI